MKLAHFIVLVIAALLAVILGTGLLSTQQGEQSFERQNLIQNFNFDTLYRVKIEGKGYKVELNKHLLSWQVIELYGYAADTEQLSELLQTLKAIEIQEYKTSNSKNYHRLGLTDVELEGAESTALTLVNDDGEITVLLGNKANTGKGQYAKLASSAQTYLLSDSLEVKTDPNDWLEQRILPYAFDEIRQLNWLDNEGAAFSVERKEQVATGELKVDEGQVVLPTGEINLKPDFELVFPEGEHQLMYQSVFTGLVRNTNQLELETVIPLSAFNSSAFEPVYTIELIAEQNGAKQTSLLSFYQDPSEQHWVVSTGQSWAYQISEFSFKQLAKPVQEYLAE